MQLALCLQDSKTSPHDGSHYADIVSRNITSLDVMIGSAEGIEVLMLEAIYHVNADNRRIAWLKCRRAISIAQMLGMDEGEKGDYANSMWFRLLYGDRIMSLELGLPHCMLTQGSDDGLDLTRQLENTHLSLSSRIIARNLCVQRQGGKLEYGETRDIDSQMREALNQLPARCWDIGSSLSAMSEDAAMMETAKLTTEMNHFWILASLYRPYLGDALLSPHESEETLDALSRLALASKEVLYRFLALRQYHRGTLYHGLDFKAYSASIDLLLVHICLKRRNQANALGSGRLRDSHLVEEMLNYMDDRKMSATTGLTISDLRKIDTDVAAGVQIRWTRDDLCGKRLYIPFVGALTVVESEGSNGSTLMDTSAAWPTAL